MSDQPGTRFSVIRAAAVGTSNPAGALDAQLRAADGEWVILLDGDDVMTPHALAALEAAIAAHPDVDLIYSDEDRLIEGIRVDPWYKPAWSPDRLRCQNYLGHLVALRRSLATDVGGFRVELPGEHEWDLLLRVGERARRVIHIDDVLVHRSGTAARDGVPDSEAARAAGLRVVGEHLRRTGFPARVVWGPRNCYELQPELPEHPLVSIVIPTGGTQKRIRGERTVLVENCVKSIVAKSTYRNIELVCVVDAATDPTVIARIRAAAGDTTLRFARSSRPFSFSERINLGVSYSRGQYLVLLNDDVEVITPEWIEHLLMYAFDPGVGAVGGTLLFEDGRLQHAGVVMVNGNPGHAFRGFPGSWGGYWRNLDVPMDCLVVTAACLMTRRDAFDAVGGMSLALPLNYNDVDFCLKLVHQGLRVVNTPGVRLTHFESASRGLAPVHAWELDLLTERWENLLYQDPFYSRHFLATADFVALEGMDGKTAADIPGASAAGMAASAGR